MKRQTLINAAVVAGGAGLTLFLFSRLGEAEPVEHELPDDLMTVGWHGTVEERTKVQQPVFKNNEPGHIAFVNTMIPALMNRGLTHDSAVLFTAHLVRETGWGKAIWNNNIGNIKASTTLRGPWFWMTDARGHHDKYRAYDTIEDGLDDDLALIRDLPRYQKSWTMLKNGDINWYGQLGLDGYYEGPKNPANPGVSTVHTPATVAPVQREYNSIVAGVQKRDQGSSVTITPTAASIDSVLAGSQGAPPAWWQLAAGGALLAAGVYYAYHELG